LKREGAQRTGTHAPALKQRDVERRLVIVVLELGICSVLQQVANGLHRQHGTARVTACTSSDRVPRGNAILRSRRTCRTHGLVLRSTAARAVWGTPGTGRAFLCPYAAA